LAQDDSVVVEYIKGVFYVFGSELATLRLLKAYRLNRFSRQGFSSNRESFYFALEPIFSKAI